MQPRSPNHWPNTKGFTLLELSISLVILAMIALFGGQLYINYTNSSRDFKAANLLYEESRFLMERIVREVRSNAIDYEEYFNQNVMIPYVENETGVTGNYGDNYCGYSNYFYDDNGESIGTRNPTLEALYVAVEPNTAAARLIENELYLINMAGNKKTIITQISEDIIGDGTMTGQVAILRMDGQDFGEDGINGIDSYNGLLSTNPACEPDDREHDGKIDTWLCDSDFPCIIDQSVESESISGCFGYEHVVVKDPTNADHSFINISPNAVDVLDLKFMISPTDDPWKAYKMYDIQMQPHITIQLTTRAHPVLVDTSNLKEPPSITLTSTVTARNYDEINSDCR